MSDRIRGSSIVEDLSNTSNSNDWQKILITNGILHFKICVYRIFTFCIAIACKILVQQDIHSLAIQQIKVVSHDANPAYLVVW